MQLQKMCWNNFHILILSLNITQKHGFDIASAGEEEFTIFAFLGEGEYVLWRQLIGFSLVFW